jgi:acyl-[acyl-carrier-protein] desaturase
MNYLLVGRLLDVLRDADLLAELAPVAGRLIDRHHHQTKEWFPHELVPWSRGRDFVPGEEWDPDEFPLDDAVRSALMVNLLTEDNLPYYFWAYIQWFKTEDVWPSWTGQWTAEEGRHSIAIRDYLTITRALDPVELERNRMHQVAAGGFSTAKMPSSADGLVYVALQELATRIAHWNTGKRIDDPVGREIMKRVAADENLHYIFYRDLVKEALEVDPSGLMAAIERQVQWFEMPGKGIPNFKVHAQAIANAGIYDVPLHYGQILVPVVMRFWGIEDLEGLDDEGKAARDRTVERIERIGRISAILADRLNRQLAEAS